MKVNIPLFLCFILIISEISSARKTRWRKRKRKELKTKYVLSLKVTPEDSNDETITYPAALINENTAVSYRIQDTNNVKICNHRKCVTPVKLISHNGFMFWTTDNLRNDVPKFFDGDITQTKCKLNLEDDIIQFRHASRKTSKYRCSGNCKPSDVVLCDGKVAGLLSKAKRNDVFVFHNISTILNLGGYTIDNRKGAVERTAVQTPTQSTQKTSSETYATTENQDNNDGKDIFESENEHEDEDDDDNDEDEDNEDDEEEDDDDEDDVDEGSIDGFFEHGSEENTEETTHEESDNIQAEETTDKIYKKYSTTELYKHIMTESIGNTEKQYNHGITIRTYDNTYTNEKEYLTDQIEHHTTGKYNDKTTIRENDLSTDDVDKKKYDTTTKYEKEMNDGKPDEHKKIYSSADFKSSNKYRTTGKYQETTAVEHENNVDEREYNSTDVEDPKEFQGTSKYEDQTGVEEYNKSDVVMTQFDSTVSTEQEEYHTSEKFEKKTEVKKYDDSYIDKETTSADVRDSSKYHTAGKYEETIASVDKNDLDEKEDRVAHSEGIEEYSTNGKYQETTESVHKKYSTDRSGSKIKENKNLIETKNERKYNESENNKQPKLKLNPRLKAKKHKSRKKVQNIVKHDKKHDGKNPQNKNKKGKSNKGINKQSKNSRHKVAQGRTKSWKQKHKEAKSRKINIPISDKDNKKTRKKKISKNRRKNTKTGTDKMNSKAGANPKSKASREPFNLEPEMVHIKETTQKNRGTDTTKEQGEDELMETELKDFIGDEEFNTQNARSRPLKHKKEYGTTEMDISAAKYLDEEMNKLLRTFIAEQSTNSENNITYKVYKITRPVQKTKQHKLYDPNFTNTHAEDYEDEIITTANPLGTSTSRNVSEDTVRTTIEHNDKNTEETTTSPSTKPMPMTSNEHTNKLDEAGKTSQKVDDASIKPSTNSEISDETEEITEDNDDNNTDSSENTEISDETEESEEESGDDDKTDLTTDETTGDSNYSDEDIDTTTFITASRYVETSHETKHTDKESADNGKDVSGEVDKSTGKPTITKEKDLTTEFTSSSDNGNNIDKTSQSKDSKDTTFEGEIATTEIDDNDSEEVASQVTNDVTHKHSVESTKKAKITVTTEKQKTETQRTPTAENAPETSGEQLGNKYFVFLNAVTANDEQITYPAVLVNSSTAISLKIHDIKWATACVNSRCDLPLNASVSGKYIYWTLEDSRQINPEFFDGDVTNADCTLNNSTAINTFTSVSNDMFTCSLECETNDVVLCEGKVAGLLEGSKEAGTFVFHRLHAKNSNDSEDADNDDEYDDATIYIEEEETKKPKSNKDPKSVEVRRNGMTKPYLSQLALMVPLTISLAIIMA